MHLETVVLVGYDIGSRVARLESSRIQALALAAPVYPGFGTRLLEPAALRERWY